MSSRILFKTYSLALLLSSFALFAQAQDGFEVPAKWRRSGAVITDQSTDFKYLLSDKGKNINYEYSETIDLLINGENGAKELAFIYLPKYYDAVVSVTGEEDFEMKQNDAKVVPAGEDIPYFFKSMFRNETEFEKISLGKLSKGDQVSISYAFDEVMPTKDFIGGKTCKSFDPQVIVFPTVYPKSAHNVSITMSRELFMNYGAQNGGPSASDESEMESTEAVFEIQAGQFDPIKAEYFSSPARSYATSKFEVVYCTSPKSTGSATLFVGNPGEANEAWSEDDLKRVTFNKIGDWDGYSKELKGLQTFLGVMRTKGTEDWLAKHYRGFQSYIYCTGKEEMYSDDLFMGVMGALMEGAEMSYQVICGVDKTTTSFDESVLNAELVYGYRVEDKKGTYNIFPFSKYSSPESGDYRVSGQDVFVYTHDKKLEDARFDEDAVPTPMPAESQMAVRTNIKLGDGYTSAIVTKSTSVSGHMKTELAEKSISEPEYHKGILSKMQFSKWSEFRNDKQAEDFKRGRKNVFHAEARAVFDTVEYQRIGLKTTGYEPTEKWLQVNEKYTVPEEIIKFEIKDSLRVYTISLGEFVTQEYPVSIADFKRDGEILVNYPHIVDSRIRFSVPEGYAVFGFDAFESSESYDKFSFSSKVSQKGQILTVITSLVIKSDDLDQNDWKELYAMLDKYQKLKDVTVTMAGN